VPLWLPLVFIFISVTLGVLALLSAVISAAETRRRRLTELKRGHALQFEVTASAKPRNVSIDPAPLLTGFLQKSDIGKRLQLEILRAGLVWRPSEFMTLVSACLLGGYSLGLFLGRGSLLMAVVFAIVGCVVPWAYLKIKQSQRERHLSAQLPDMLDILSSSLRSGHSFLSGVQIVCNQMQPPITEELERVIQEVRFGASLTNALGDLITRTENYDMELIIQAVQTQLTVGGNLAEILDNIGTMIRDRVALAGEISAATAEGRLSAMILGGMPFALGIIVNTTSPGYLTPLFTDPFGLIMLGGAITLMIIGVLIIRSILNVDL